jgi:hypothetical protein
MPVVPPGEYGLKVGHEAYAAAEVYPGKLFREHPESFDIKGDTWKRSKIVKLGAGRESGGVAADYPHRGSVRPGVIATSSLICDEPSIRPTATGRARRAGVPDARP